MQRPRVDLFDEIECLDHLGQIFTRNIHPRAAAEADADEDRVEFLLHFSNRDVPADFHATTNFHAQLLNHPDLEQTRFGRHFVISDTVSVEPAGLRLLFEDDRLMAELRELSRAAQARRAATHDCDAFARLPRWRVEQLRSVIIHVIRRVSLQPADFYRRAFAVQHDTRPLAQNFGRTHSGATGAQNVRAENRSRGTGQVASGDFLDEGRNINAGRAGLNAGGIEAKHAAVGLDDGLLSSIARRNLGHIGRCGFRSQLWLDWHKQKLQRRPEQARRFAHRFYQPS